MMPSRREITFLTSNDNKFKEVQAILGDATIVTRYSLDLLEIQGSLQDICRFKCRKAADAVRLGPFEQNSLKIQQISGPVLVDDTSLSFNALGGLPGPYIKWFIQGIGSQNLHKLLNGFSDKSAEAICIFAYCKGPKDEPRLFEGRTKGRIVPGRGRAGFGWDSVFEVEGQTYAEMDENMKNQISHRFKALKSFQNWYSLLEEA